VNMHAVCAGATFLLVVASTGQAQPVSLLDAKFQNPAYDTSNQTWAKSVCQDNVWMHGASPPLEWTPIPLPGSPNSQMVAVSGIALDAHPSTSDVWFTHPFGFDWNFNAVWSSNPNYDYLAAPRYREGADAEDDAARLGVVNSGVENARFIHVEMDGDFVPDFFKAKDGDSVAVFGRWIVDCGHENYSSEIHPPLLFAKASSSEDGSGTNSTLISRPFLVTQEFDGRSLFAHLNKQFAEIANVAVISPIAPGLTVLGYRLNATTEVSNLPFSGIQLFSYEIRPPRKSNGGERLAVSYHFTTRTGVAVNLANLGDDRGTILVSVVMNDALYKPAELPPSEPWHIPTNDVRQYNNLDVGIALLDTQATIIGAPAIAYVIEKGVDTRRYKFPTYSEPPNKSVFADQLRNNTVTNIDDSQFFPIRGAISVRWVPDRRTVISRPAPNPKAQVPQPPSNPMAKTPQHPVDPKIIVPK
jgi:hypothetical protein